MCRRPPPGNATEPKCSLHFGAISRANSPVAYLNMPVAVDDSFPASTDQQSTVKVGHAIHGWRLDPGTAALSHCCL